MKYSGHGYPFEQKQVLSLGPQEVWATGDGTQCQRQLSIPPPVATVCGRLLHAGERIYHDSTTSKAADRPEWCAKIACVLGQGSQGARLTKHLKSVSPPTASTPPPQ
jgi:hypothetical protein